MALNFPSSPNVNDTHSENGTSWKWDGGSWVRLSATGNQGFQGFQGVQGAQGLQGVQGAQGEQGSTGAQGAQGLQGVQGATGSAGGTGPQGEQGATGNASTVAGPQGEQGAQGLQGEQGAVGAQGAQGHQGVQGTAGTVGAQGAQGRQGAQGLQGEQGAVGAQGAQGRQGSTGSTGGTGPQGVQGAQGRQGATGSAGGTGPQGVQGATGPDGGNAGTLDNLDSSQFLRSDANDTYTGVLTGSGASRLSFSNTNTNYDTAAEIPTSGCHIITGADNGTSTSVPANINFYSWYGVGFGPSITGQTVTKGEVSHLFNVRNGDAVFQGTLSAGNVTINSNQVWHSGNDGSGSGLDADTVDGINSASLLRSDANDEYRGGKLEIKSDSVNGHYAGFGLEYHTSSWRHTNANSWGFAFRNSAGVLDIYSAQEAGTDGGVATYRAFRIGGSSSLLQYSGSNVWHAGNDGSGSGLDADTVDGIQGASFLRSDANDSATGLYSFAAGAYSANVTYGGRSIQTQIDINSTSMRGGVLVRNANDFRSETASASFMHYDAYNTSSTSYAFRAAKGTTLADTFWVKGDGTAYFAGTVNITGNLVATGTVTSGSDIKLKKNIETIPNSLDIVKSMRGVYFHKKDDDTRRHVGVIAQEVEELLPEVIHEDEKGIKSVAYGNIVSVLIEAVKEQNGMIKTLTEKIEALEKK